MNVHGLQRQRLWIVAAALLSVAAMPAPLGVLKAEVGVAGMFCEL